MAEYISNININGTNYPIKIHNTIQNISVATSDWVASTYNTMYPYEATIIISDLTNTDIVSPKFNNMDIIKYMISSEITINDGSFTIYTVNKPTDTIIIPEINYYKTI